MRIHEQRDTYLEALRAAEQELREMQSRIIKKIGFAYPDGTRDNLINAQTDVLPVLNEIISKLGNIKYHVHGIGVVKIHGESTT